MTGFSGLTASMSHDPLAYSRILRWCRETVRSASTTEQEASRPKVTTGSSTTANLGESPL